jgi:hypothetical protein
MLAVPESMVKPIMLFLCQLFTGDLRDPEALSITLQGLAMQAMPEAHAARLLRSAYRRNVRADVGTLGDEGWLDRSESGQVVPFARKEGEDSSIG